MKSQAMRLYEARNVLADQPIMIWSPELVKGRIIFDWRPATKISALTYAGILFNGRGLAHLDKRTRAKLINFRYLRGISFKVEQLQLQKYFPQKGRRR